MPDRIQILIGGLTVKAARPTLKHRLAIAPGIFGTVYAINAEGEARYFDYNYAAARAFAGLDTATDIRYAKSRGRFQFVRTGAIEANPRVGTPCYWVAR